MCAIGGSKVREAIPCTDTINDNKNNIFPEKEDLMLSFLWQGEKGKEHKSGVQTVREAIPCTDTIDDNSNNISPENQKMAI